MLAVHDKTRAAALSDAFSRASWRVAANVDPGVCRERPPLLWLADVLVMDGRELAGYRRCFHSFAAWLHPRARLLIVANHGSLAEMIYLPRPVDGLLFLDDGLRPQQIDLAMAGYTCVPAGKANLLPQPSWRGRFTPLLSLPEQQVLGFLAKGFSNREIAEALQFSEARTKTIVRAVLRKLGVRNRTIAGIIGARAAWADPSFP